MIVLSVRKSTLFSVLLFCVMLAVSFSDFSGPFIWFIWLYGENDMQYYFKFDSRQQKIHDHLEHCMCH